MVLLQLVAPLERLRAAGKLARERPLVAVLRDHVTPQVLALVEAGGALRAPVDARRLVAAHVPFQRLAALAREAALVAQQRLGGGGRDIAGGAGDDLAALGAVVVSVRRRRSPAAEEAAIAQRAPLPPLSVGRVAVDGALVRQDLAEVVEVRVAHGADEGELTVHAAVLPVGGDVVERPVTCRLHAPEDGLDAMLRHLR